MKLKFFLNKFCFFTTVLFLIFFATGCKQKKVTNTIVAEDDSQQIDTLPTYIIPTPDSIVIVQFINDNPDLKDLSKDLEEFYSKRHYHCAWFNEYGLTEQTGKVVNLIRDYIQAGMVDTTIFIPGVVELYDTITSETFSPKGNDSLVLQADLFFTSQFIRFADDAWKGLKAEKIKQLDWFLPVNKPSQIDYLSMLLSPETKKVEGTEPVFGQFLRLKEKVKLYADIEKNGGWDSIPQSTTSLKTGDTSEVIIALRKRLFLTGDFTGNTSTNIFDSSFVETILAMRECYGLSNDTIIDSRLIRELNIPVALRLRKMMINIERWKWVPADPGANFIAVNIPEYMMHVFENGKVIKDMKVIVGKTANQTVVFSGDLKYVVLSPYWVIPRSIIVKETLPALKRNPGYLSRHNMEVVTNTNPPKVVPPSQINYSNYSGSNFPYVIRQKPGPSNSLGYVKFLFPNSFSIYLHDTPSRNLFEENTRSFSHGCIRIAEPLWLADYLLRNDTVWNEESIKTAMHSGKEKYVTLKETIPVYITYFTSWVDKNGRLNFRKDIYGHDQKLEKELFQ